MCNKLHLGSLNPHPEFLRGAAAVPGEPRCGWGLPGPPKSAGTCGPPGFPVGEASGRSPYRKSRRWGRSRCPATGRDGSGSRSGRPGARRARPGMGGTGGARLHLRGRRRPGAGPPAGGGEPGPALPPRWARCLGALQHGLLLLLLLPARGTGRHRPGERAALAPAPLPSGGVRAGPRDRRLLLLFLLRCLLRAAPGQSGSSARRGCERRHRRRLRAAVAGRGWQALAAAVNGRRERSPGTALPSSAKAGSGRAEPPLPAATGAPGGRIAAYLCLLG